LLYLHPARLWHPSRTQQLHADGYLPLPARRALLSLYLLPVPVRAPALGQATLLLLPNYSILDDDIVSFRRSFSVIESTHNSRLIIEDCPVLESCATLTTYLTRIASHFARLPLSFIPNQRPLRTRGCWRQALGTRYRSRIEGLRSHSPPRCEGTGRTEDVIHDPILIPISIPILIPSL
jgi:hypothetical protein